MSPFRLTVAIFAIAFSANAYVLVFNDAGLAKRWVLLTPQSGVSTNVVNTNTHAIRYYLGANGFSVTNTAAELNAIRASVGQWMAVSNTYIKFEEAGLAVGAVDVNLNDHSNIFYWSTTTNVNGGNDNIHGANGVTFSTFSGIDNTMIEADIAFNGAEKSWFTDITDQSNPNVFVEGVALHELGHFLGLNHSPLGGATMLFAGPSGVNLQAGLSSDEITGARFLYPTAAANFGAIKGTVTKSGNPVLGAAVFAQSSPTNIIEGTVTLGNGAYEFNALVPGTYQVRVAPLDPFVAARLCSGRDIAASSSSTNNNYVSADTSFLPTTNMVVTVTAGTTNTANFAVANGSLAFRITAVRSATSNPNSFSWGAFGTSLAVGQSNFTVGVVSASLPSNNASLLIPGDGLTLGSPSFLTNPFGNGLNFISVPVSVASNATPGLRSFIVTQGSDIAYANGFLEIRPAVLDYNFDGLDDLFQREYFSVFTAAQAAPGADPDVDGMNNAAEYIAGTDPTNAASKLAMQSVTRTNTTATVRWQSVSGRKYQVAYRTNLVSGGWSNIGSVVTAGGANALLTDTTATNATRFYRAQVVP